MLRIAVTLILCVAIATALVPTQRKRACVAPHNRYPFCDTSLSLEARVADLISRVKDADKPSLLTARGWPQGNITSLADLGVPGNDWGLNCVHGIQSSCIGDKCPTSFPNPNLFGATWNSSNVRAMGAVMRRELRALWLAGAREPTRWSGAPLIGLDCWSPNINLNRDPRWGRNQEVASEDPMLTADYAQGYTESLQQGEDPRFLAGVATIKHYAAYSLEDSDGHTRFNFDAKVSPYDLYDSYLVAFRRGVVDAKAKGLMCSYNALNGVPTCASSFLKKTLRDEWNYDGYVTSDTGAIQFIYQQHNYTKTAAEAACVALKQGPTDMDSGFVFVKALMEGVSQGLCSMADIDKALANTMRVRFELGLFDPVEDQPYWNVSMDEVHSTSHVAQSQFSAEQGMVLLQQSSSSAKKLPRLPGAARSVAVIGPSANDTRVMLGNYLGWLCPGGVKDFSCIETPLAAIQRTYANSNVQFAAGCSHNGPSNSADEAAAEAAVRSASDVFIFMGLDQSLEAEMHDRTQITLPEVQAQLLRKLRAAASADASITVVLINGGAISLGNLSGLVDNIIEAWYPGQYGAAAIARTLSGAVTPGGKLPITIYPSDFISELPMDDMSMTGGVGRTYRYYNGTPEFQFGFGLSYTTFAVTVQQEGIEGLTFTGTVRNTGAFSGDEVVQAYLSVVELNPKPAAGAQSIVPQRWLVGYERVHADVGQTTPFTIKLTKESFSLVSTDGSGKRRVLPGRYALTFTDGLTVHQRFVLEL